MAVTETTTQSWGSRLGNALKGVLIGLGLFILGFPLLFWNEGDTVKTRKALDEGEGACVHIEDITKVDPENEGKLVHMSGKADTKDVLTDGQFGVSETAIKLIRKVEMYQWQESSHTETKKNVGGSETTTTTYTHKQVWSSSIIPSPSHPEPGQNMTNPGVMEFESSKLLAEQVSFGAFRLSKSQIDSIGEETPYVFPEGWKCPIAQSVRNGSIVYIPNATYRTGVANAGVVNSAADATASNEVAAPVPFRDVVSTPRIGDMRVRFEIVKPHEISLVAKQYGDTFVGYTASNGKSVQLLMDGIKDSAEMFAAAQNANTMKCWLLRLVGFLMMFIGLSMVFKPLSVLGDVIPAIGSIIELGTGLVAFVIALVCSLVTIAIAWLFYRPILGITLLVAAGGLVAWLVSKKKKSIPPAPATSETPATPEA